MRVPLPAPDDPGRPPRAAGQRALRLFLLHRGQHAVLPLHGGHRLLPAAALRHRGRDGRSSPAGPAGAVLRPQHADQLLLHARLRAAVRAVLRLPLLQRGLAGRAQPAPHRAHGVRVRRGLCARRRAAAARAQLHAQHHARGRVRHPASRPALHALRAAGAAAHAAHAHRKRRRARLLRRRGQLVLHRLLPARVRSDRRARADDDARTPWLAQGAAGRAGAVQRRARTVRPVRAGDRSGVHPLVVRSGADAHAGHALRPARAPTLPSRRCAGRAAGPPSLVDRLWDLRCGCLCAGHPAPPAGRPAFAHGRRRSDAAVLPHRRIRGRRVPRAFAVPHAHRRLCDADDHPARAALRPGAGADRLLCRLRVQRLHQHRRRLTALRRHGGGQRRLYARTDRGADARRALPAGAGGLHPHRLQPEAAQLRPASRAVLADVLHVAAHLDRRPVRVAGGAGL